MLRQIISRLQAAVLTYPERVLVGSLALLIVALWLGRGVEFRTARSELAPPDDPDQKRLEEIGREFTGSSALIVCGEAAPPAAGGDPDSWCSASYTLSRAVDLGSDPLREGIWLPSDSDNIPGERARSDADRRHRMVLAGESRLPWLGLRTSAVVQLASAAPFNVTTGRVENLDGVTTDRPAGVHRNTGESTPLGPINATRDHANILRQQLGLAPLPPILSIPSPPRQAQIDLKISRPFAWRDQRGAGEFFVQVFNVLDRWNGGPIQGRVTSVDFGLPIGQLGPPRTIEAGLKIGL